jgi:hypothetical protein
MLPEEGCLLRIFIGESDHHGEQPLYEWLVLRAREEGLAGATVLRGIMGFGPQSRIHTAKILRLSQDLPIVVEIVDTEERLEAFLAMVQDDIREGLVTMERACVQLYRG